MIKLSRNQLIGFCIGLAICLMLFMFLAWDAVDTLRSCTATTERLIQDFQESLDLNKKLLLSTQECLDLNDRLIQASQRCTDTTDGLLQDFLQCVEFSEDLLTDLQTCRQESP